MNATPFRTLLITLTLVGVVLGGSALYWGGLHASKRAQIDQEYQELVAKAVKMESADYYPNAQNVLNYKQDLKSYVGRLEGVKQSFKINSLEQLPGEDKTFEALHDEMQKVFTAFQSQCLKQNVSFSKEIDWGKGAEESLEEGESMLLYNRVCMTRWLLQTLLDIEIISLNRFDQASEQQMTIGKESAILYRDPMVLGVTLKEKSLIPLFKVLAESDYFISIKGFKIKTHEKTSMSESNEQNVLVVEQVLGRDEVDVILFLECITLAN